MSEQKSAEKRLAIIKLAEDIGLKKAAEIYKCSTRTILRWKKRYNFAGSEGLLNSPKSGVNQPSRLPDKITEQIIGLKTANPKLTAQQIKTNLSDPKPSLSAIYKKIQQAGLGKKKNKTNSKTSSNQNGSIDQQISGYLAEYAKIKDSKEISYLSEIVFKLADLYIKQDNKSTKAIEILQSLKNQAERQKRYSIIYEICNRLGSLWEERKKFTNAMDLFQMQLNYAVKTNNKENLASAYFNLGYCSALQNHQKEAIAYFLQAKDHAILAKKNDFLAKIHNNLGICYQELNDFSKAQESFRQAYQLSQKQGDKQLFLTNLAIVYQAGGKNTDLIKFLNDELIYFRKHKDLSGELMTLTTMQMNAFESGNYELALTCFKDTVELAKQLNRPEIISRSYHYISQFYLETDNIAQSINYINQAIELAIEYESDEDLAEFRVFKILYLYFLKDYQSVQDENSDFQKVALIAFESHTNQVLLNVIVMFTDFRQVILENPVDLCEIKRILNLIFSFTLQHVDTGIELLICFFLSEILFENNSKKYFSTDIEIVQNKSSLSPHAFISQSIAKFSHFLDQNQHSLFSFLNNKLKKLLKELND